MTNLNFLSAALIAAAIATPAMARESHVTLKHRANATAGERYVDRRLCNPAPAVGAFATQPWDNGPPCEPASVDCSVRVVDRPRRALLPGNETLSAQPDFSLL